MNYRLLGLSLVACLLLVLAFLSATGLNKEEACPSCDRDVVKPWIVPQPLPENDSFKCRPGCVWDPEMKLCVCTEGS